MNRRQHTGLSVAEGTVERLQQRLRESTEYQMTTQSSIQTAGVAFLVGQSEGWCDIFPLHTKLRITIGRSGRNDVVVSDEKCSRLHCKIVWRQGHWLICDVGSRNGTYVNGRLVQGYRPLRPGDQIRVSSRTFLFSDDITEGVSGEEMWQEPRVILDHVARHVKSVEDVPAQCASRAGS